METHIGLELCTAGTAEKMTVNGKCTVAPGTLMILSPMFPMLETRRSDDYASVLLQDSIESIFPIITQSLPSPQNLPNITPYLRLSDVQQQHFLQNVAQIQEKELQLRELQHPVQQKMLSTVIGLLRQATLLEHAFLFSAQLLQQGQKPSWRRQVLLSFVLTLNMECHQQRSVSYYAEMQNLTPRHFSDIVKQESGYTPMEWINMVTVNQAKSLLRKPDIQIKQVADELGFPEQFTFRKYFKAHTGMSPTEFRKGGK
jgi:AraC-like DNA-binding protein